ncbi:hypothetical protein Taro_046665 [Colocasia esculenta]|uniref:GBF-interacting protein 1 N-terminal domain-containing protein n=1 Tax=Colocasia esculenta TaxID=4460 RepID=A0A843WZB9_COLES|nr:hypothetical protein [Colocasia esculenta]
MVVGSRGDGGTLQYKVSAKVQATINSIREIVGGHSDAEILAVLRETEMDPNETTQRLLYQGLFFFLTFSPFFLSLLLPPPLHFAGGSWEVLRLFACVFLGVEQCAWAGFLILLENLRFVVPRVVYFSLSGAFCCLVLAKVRLPVLQGTQGTRKRNTGSKGPTEPKKPVDQSGQWMKSNTSWDRNSRRGNFAKNSSPGINREFRVVRDNRVNQNNDLDVKPDMSHNSISGDEQVGSSLPEKSLSGILNNDKHSPARTEGKLSSTGPSKADHHSKVADASGSHRTTTLDTGLMIAKPSQTQKGAAAAHNSVSVSVSTSSSGMYASSSDPVHVPSPDSRSAGTVGAIRREVGVVGGRRQSTERPTSHSSFSNSSFSLPALGKDISAATESVGQPKGSQLNQTLASEPYIPVGTQKRPFFCLVAAPKEQGVLHKRVGEKKREGGLLL